MNGEKQSEQTKQVSEPDSNMTLIVDLYDMEFKILEILEIKTQCNRNKECF